MPGKPMIPMDFTDPDLIRIKNTYVMVSSSEDMTPGGQVVISDDLKEWKTASYLFNDTEWLEQDEISVNGGYAMSAPSLRYYEGKLYVAFMCEGGHNTHLFVAESPYGPWEHHTIEGNYPNLSLFFDDDDRKYIVYGQNEIQVTELDKDMSGPLKDGFDRTIIVDSMEELVPEYEGAHFYKINGKYVLLLIHVPMETGLRTQAVYVSDSLEDNFYGKDVLSESLFFGSDVEQGGIFDTPDGQWYSVLSRQVGEAGMFPELCPLKWTDKYPKFKTEYDLSGNDSKIEVRTDGADDDLICNKNFASDNGITFDLALAWQWYRQSQNELWKLIDPTTVGIKTDKVVKNPILANNILTQRLLYPVCMTEVTIDTEKMCDGDVAGLLAFCDNSVLLGVKKEKNRLALIKTECNDGDSRLQSAKVNTITYIGGTRATVMMKTDFTGSQNSVTLYYKENGKWRSWYSKWKTHSVRSGREKIFGIRIGLCVYSTKQSGGTSIFKNFYMGEKERGEIDDLSNGLSEQTAISIRDAAMVGNVEDKQRYAILKNRSKTNLKLYLKTEYMEDGLSFPLSKEKIALYTLIDLGLIAVLIRGAEDLEIAITASGILILAAAVILITAGILAGLRFYVGKRTKISRNLTEQYDNFIALWEQNADIDTLEKAFEQLRTFVITSDESRAIVNGSVSDNYLRFEIVSDLIASEMTEEREQFLLEFMDMNNDKVRIKDEKKKKEIKEAAKKKADKKRHTKKIQKKK